MTINENKGAAECFFEKAITKIISIICNVNDGDKFNAIPQKCASAQKLGMNIVRGMDDLGSAVRTSAPFFTIEI